MDLDDVVEELYGNSPEEFMERRTALVAQARASGDRTLAKTIGQLRKPTRSAWLVNLVAREAADDLAHLLEIGAALRQAQADLSGPELRRLSKERHDAIETLARRAAALGGARGYSVSDAAFQEVSQTLQAALADESTSDAVRAGRVIQSLSYGGFGLPDMAVVPPSTKAATNPATVAEEDVKHPSAAELKAAQAALEEANAALSSAEAEAAESARRFEAVSTELAELRTRVEDLERAEKTAREAVGVAEERLGSLRAEAAQRTSKLNALTGAP